MKNLIIFIRGKIENFLSIRGKIGIFFSKKMLPFSYTIISDDCWAGQLEKQLGIAYSTPTVGLYIVGNDYINFIKNICMPNASQLDFVESAEDFPVAVTPFTKLYFMHFKDEKEALDKFSRRFKRIDYDNIFFKIDLGKPGVTEQEIVEWNNMKLPNSVAFYPPSVTQFVHNGIMIEEWVLDGAAMFNICRKYFDVFTWLKKGELNMTITYKILNFLFLDPTSFARVKNFRRWSKRG